MKKIADIAEKSLRNAGRQGGWGSKIANSFILLAVSVIFIKKRWSPGGVGEQDRGRIYFIGNSAQKWSETISHSLPFEGGARKAAEKLANC